MEVIREIELDATADEVWPLLADPEELAAWVGDEVRGAPVQTDEGAHRVEWTWSPGGRESSVEVTVEELDDRALVRVVERAPTGGGSARACARWDGAGFGLEVRLLLRAPALA